MRSRVKKEKDMGGSNKTSNIKYKERSNFDKRWPGRAIFYLAQKFGCDLD